MMNPHLVRSLNIIRKWFVEIFNDQKPFTHQTCQEVIFKILEARNKKLKDRVIERWSKCEQTVERMWGELCDEVDHYELAGSDEEYPLRSHEISNRKFQRMTFI